MQNLNVALRNFECMTKNMFETKQIILIIFVRVFNI